MAFPKASQAFTPSVDGWVGRINAIAPSFSALRSGAGNESNDGSTGINGLLGTQAAGNWDDLRRMVMVFDISSIAATEQVTDASLTVRPTVNPSDGFGGREVIVVQSNPASNVALVNTDYALANFGMTVPLSVSVALTAMAASVDEVFVFTDDGRAYLQSVIDAQSGFAKLAIVWVADQADSPPTATPNTNAQLNLSSSEGSLLFGPRLDIVTEEAPPVTATGGGQQAVERSIQQVRDLLLGLGAAATRGIQAKEKTALQVLDILRGGDGTGIRGQQSWEHTLQQINNELLGISQGSAESAEAAATKMRRLAELGAFE